MIKPDLLRLSEVLGRIFMRLIGISWRIEYSKPSSGRTGRARRKPVFYAFWHGRQLPLIYTHRNEGITVLVSRNVDGQYVTNVLHSMGFGTIRGSSSRGGMRAIRQMASTLKEGTDCAITPDGPRGPSEKAKSGMAYISRLGGRPVVPMGTSAWPAVRFKSWDSFIFPIPFAKVAVVEGRPISPLKRGEDAELWTERVETELNRVTACSDFLASPSSSFFSFIVGIFGRLIRPFAALALIFRPERERKERKGYVKKHCARPVWFHGSSLGELNGLIPYAEYLKEQGIPVWITCFTPSGRSYIDRMSLDGSYIPLDIPYYSDRFIKRLSPRAFVLAETEIWPNTLINTVNSGIPCMMINARLSESSLKGYSLLGSLPAKLLSCFTGILARSEEDLNRFLKMGVTEKNMKVSGDSKILTDHGEPPGKWRRLLGTAKPVLVAGSTRKGEEEVLLKAVKSANYFPVIVPRHIDRVDEVRDIMVRMGFAPVRWTELTVSELGELDFDSVLVDVHGVLAQMYGIGDAGFVGGTLVPIGGHNVLEPPMRGVPLIVGQYYDSFGEIVDELVKSGVAHIASSDDELYNILKCISRDKSEIVTVRTSFDNIRSKVLKDFTSMINRAGIRKTVK